MRPSSLEKRQRYLASAIELFLEQGYDNTNMAQLIERCGGSKLTLYNYFGDKQGLLRAVVAELTEPSGEALALPLPDARPPRQQLMSFAVNYLHFVYDPRRLKLCRLVMTRVHKDPDLIHFFLERSAYHSQSVLGTFLKALDSQAHCTSTIPIWPASNCSGRCGATATSRPSTPTPSRAPPRCAAAPSRRWMPSSPATAAIRLNRADTNNNATLRWRCYRGRGEQDQALWRSASIWAAPLITACREALTTSRPMATPQVRVPSTLSST